MPHISGGWTENFNHTKHVSGITSSACNVQHIWNKCPWPTICSISMVSPVSWPPHRPRLKTCCMITVLISPRQNNILSDQPMVFEGDQHDNPTSRLILWISMSKKPWLYWIRVTPPTLVERSVIFLIDGNIWMLDTLAQKWAIKGQIGRGSDLPQNN